MAIHLKRIYEAPAKADGTRVLVDRIWPRGVRKEQAAVDLWLKEVAPSSELRKWFGHDPARWPEFGARYRRELEAATDGLKTLKQLTRRGDVTLLYAARDEAHNNAVALREYLEGH